MNTIKKLGLLGKIIMVIGALMYVVEMLKFDNWTYNLVLTGLFSVSIVLMAIEWFATLDEKRERRAKALEEKARKKMEREKNA